MIKQKIENILKDISAGDVKIEIFAPENEAFGYYSTNLALKLAKISGKNPMEIAENFKSQILIRQPADKSGFFKKIEAVNPGFINFWLSEKILQDELKEILKQKENYGRLKVKNSKLKDIQVEFISANPTGPLTLANGRGGFMGDVLANILEFQGYKVEREYYVNDTGNQIFILGKSLAASAGLISAEENLYQGNYIKEWTKKKSIAVKKYGDDYLKIGQRAAKDFLFSIKKVLTKEAKINFDRWTSEDRHIHKKSFVKKALEIFKKKKLTYEKDGALWLKTTRFGDDKDRVLITQDGFPTYFLADAGHFLETKSRGFNSKIMILGPDHHGYVKRAAAAAKIMGIENFEVIITQAMRLMSKGEEIKMSKRSGEFVTFEELLKETGADAARFFFLMHLADSHMDFDLDLAKERSMKNPVYYVQYAAVRCNSILRKSQITNHKSQINSKLKNLKLLNTKEDLNLMRQLARFPEAVSEAVEKRQPQILARYALELAREFHNFYEKERIIPVRRSLGEGGGEEKKIMSARLALIQATLTIFKNLFILLGVSMLRRM